MRLTFMLPLIVMAALVIEALFQDSGPEAVAHGVLAILLLVHLWRLWWRLWHHQEKKD